MFWDVLRVIAAVLYVALIAQIVATVSYYVMARNNEKNKGVDTPGVLPVHVIVMASVLLILAAEAVFQNLDRIHEGWSSYAIINPIIFGAAWWAIWLVTDYERKRYHNSKR